MQYPAEFGGCAGIPRFLIRHTCSSIRLAASFWSVTFFSLQSFSAAALARGNTNFFKFIS